MAVEQATPTAMVAAAPPEILLPDETRGIKRKLEESRADSPALQETLTPVSRSRTSSPHPAGSEKDLEFYDDGHSDFEYIRVPKKRDYDLFKVARQLPSERDSAELPLVVRRTTDGKEVTMWAKMDTGADSNVINRSTVHALFGAETEKKLRTLTLAEKGDFSLVGDNHFLATHYAVLSFRAGHSNKHFDSVRFIVIPDDWQDPDGDGVPNVILGYPFLRENSMMMIDLDFHQAADPGLDVVAERAQSEKEGSRAILINMLPRTAGVQRPGPKRPR